MLKTIYFISQNFFKFLLIFCCLSKVQAAPNVPECSETPLDHTFPSGSAWSMCVSLDHQEGLVIKQLMYKADQVARRVLSKGSLSQLETVFDDNSTPATFAVTREGLGGDKLISLSPKHCEGGNLSADSTGRKVICSRIQEDGLLYNYAYQAHAQSAFLEVFTISQATNLQTYTQRWRFYENGIIEPALGFSGKLPRYSPANLGFGRAVKDSEQWALGFSSYLGWRLDFDLGKNGNNDVAEELTSTPSASRRQKRLSTEVLSLETARNLNPELKTTWRIKDADEVNPFGQVISYEIIPSQYHQSASNVRERPWLKNDIYFSRYRDCEQYASDNKADDCARNALQYTQDKEAINKADLVVWYKQNYHYLPRSDDSDYISTEWVSFQLLPRDWTAGNPL